LRETLREFSALAGSALWVVNRERKHGTKAN
jgi:hypothetical protein